MKEETRRAVVGGEEKRDGKESAQVRAIERERRESENERERKRESKRVRASEREKERERKRARVERDLLHGERGRVCEREARE